MSRAHGLIAAAKMIEARVAGLEAEFERTYRTEDHKRSSIASHDRGAILEARLLAEMIRLLSMRPFRGDPFEVAKHRRGRQPEHFVK